MARSRLPAAGSAEGEPPAEDASPVRKDAGTAKPGAARPGSAPSRTPNGKAPGRAAKKGMGSEPASSSASPVTPGLGHEQGSADAGGRSRGRGPVRQERGSGGRTASRIRFLNLELTNPHQMTPAEIATFLVLYLALMAGAGVVVIVLFDHLLDALAAHASQLRQLNPSEVETTIYGVWGFIGIALAARTILRLTRRNEPADENDPGLGLSPREEIDLSAQED